MPIYLLLKNTVALICSIQAYQFAPETSNHNYILVRSFAHRASQNNHIKRFPQTSFHFSALLDRSCDIQASLGDLIITSLLGTRNLLYHNFDTPLDA